MTKPHIIEKGTPLPKVHFAHRLLALGGERVIAFHVDLAWEEAAGPVAFKEAKFKKMEPSRCHANSAILYLKNPAKRTIWTGYALSPDGLWREHSWSMLGTRLTETTVPRLVYYGAPVTPGRSSVTFALQNVEEWDIHRVLTPEHLEGITAEELALPLEYGLL